MMKYPGMQHITYNELVEFTKRVAIRAATNRSYSAIEPYIAAVYHEMAREQADMEGVSAEGAAWAMESAA